MGLVEAYRRYDGEGQGLDVRGQDNAEMHELFVTPDGVYYLLAGPRLAEAHNSSTVVPLTGSARSAPKPLTISNLLYSQHQSDDQHKDVVNEPSIKTRLAQFVSMNRQPLNVLPKGRYEAEGAGRRGMYEGGGATTRTKTTPRCTSCSSPRPESTTC